MSTINATLRIALDVLEEFTAAEIPLVSQPSVLHNQANLSKSLNASSTPAGTKVYAQQLTGTQNLDLTSLTDTIGNALDCSGLKLQALLIKNLSTTDPLTISDGAANPYSINGTHDVDVPIGCTFGFEFGEQLADVAAGALAIDITPAAGQSFQLVMVFG